MRTDIEAAVIAAALGVLAGGAPGVHPPVEHRRKSTLHPTNDQTSEAVGHLFGHRTVAACPMRRRTGSFRLQA